MKKLKIGFFEVEDIEKKKLSIGLGKDDLMFSSQKLNSKNANKLFKNKIKDLDILSVFVHSKIDEDVLAQMPNLKLITTRSVGFDHIDLCACKKRNIPVCYVSNYGQNTVAEHTFALILALSRKIVESVDRTRKGNFDISGLRGIDLKDKTLGVIGTGNIGRYVIKIGCGFGMKVIAFDACKDENFEKEDGFKYVTLNTLLKKSDVVTLHVPYCPGTHHLIDVKKIALMKPNAILINTSRGGIIETAALVRAIEKKKIAGAGLDVLEGECDLIEEWELKNKKFKCKCDEKIFEENHVLLSMPNVLITPHNAFNTKEALDRILKTTIETIVAFKKGRIINKIKC